MDTCFFFHIAHRRSRGHHLGLTFYIPYFVLEFCFSLGLELMIGLFSVFEVMKPQRDFMEESYDSGEYKLMHIYNSYEINFLELL